MHSVARRTAGAASSFERMRLVEEIRAEGAQLPYPLCDRPLSARVLDAIGTVPREAFMPHAEQRWAYVNAPASIGYGQTISQPFIVALMTDLLDVSAEDVVLEIGTGSGYQAAVLSGLVAELYSVEIVEPLADAARERLRAMHYDNVHVRTGDGGDGWSEHAPYDAVIVTAASGHVPPALVAQMRAGARMIIPIGGPDEVQWLTVVDKQDDANVFERRVLAVRFVPLTSRVD